MALTFRSNGVAGGLVSAQWWNDYYNLFTGAMTDQPISITNSLSLEGVTFTTPAAPTLGTAAGTSLGVGSYTYAVGYQMGNGLSKPGTTGAITTTTGNTNVNLSVIPTGPTGTTGRVLYRSKVGTSSPLYVLHTISDNTTTTYTDSTADSSLTTQAPSHGSFGGALLIYNQSGVQEAGIYNDGSVSFDGGKFLSDGAGNIMIEGGKVGVVSSGDLINASGGDLIFNTPTGVSTNVVQFNYPGGNIMHIAKDYVIVNSVFGVKNTSFMKLMEVRANGNMIISGTQYATSSGSVSTASGQSFDSFDIAEVYPTDQEYPSGTVVCPGPTNLLTQCTHDNCPFALVVSSVPGLILGTPIPVDEGQGIQLSISLAGRVNIKTAFDIPSRSFVVSDGRGGVREAAHGENAFVLGFTLNETVNAQVGVFLKSYFGVVV